MSKDLIIQKFCTDYDVKVGTDAYKNIVIFADEVKSTEVLRKVLDSSNHPISEGGRRSRPNVATLKILLGQFINERAADKRREAMSSVTPDEYCFYCTSGYILGIQERNGLWSTYIAGRCECAQGDETGYMMHWRPTRPTREIQDDARDHGMTCAETADRIIYERNKSYRDERESVEAPRIYQHIDPNFVEEQPGIPF